MPARSQFRSGLERRLARQLQGLGVKFDYESFKIPYTQPLQPRLYLPDFILPNAILIEAKGLWETADRQKFLMIKDTYPDLDIRFVFSRANQTISKRSKTTYAKYCKSNDWLYSEGEIPMSWIKAPLNKASARALKIIMDSPINK